MTTGGRATQGSRTDADPIIAVVGLGRVGLITAVGMAELGWQVFGAESDCAKAQMIRQGIVPFYEEGVEEPLRAHLASARLNVENSVSAAIERADVVFVCVGTPEGLDGAADVSELGKVAAAIGASLDGYKLVVQKSTCPVETSEMIERVVAEHAANGGPGEGGFDVAVNPEFLREGRAMYDFLHPTRIVLGVDSDRAASLLRRVYKPLLDGMGRDAESTVVVTDRGTAEIVKHAANAFLATKISFANIVADLCEATGANIEHVTRALGMDPRIGPYLGAGIGYGGSCLPKDVRAFASVAERFGVDFSLLAEVHRANEAPYRPICREGAGGDGVGRRRHTGGLGAGVQAGDRRRAGRAEPADRRRAPGGGRCAAPVRPQGDGRVRRPLPVLRRRHVRVVAGGRGGRRRRPAGTHGMARIPRRRPRGGQGPDEGAGDRRRPEHAGPAPRPSARLQVRERWPALSRVVGDVIRAE